MQPPPRKGNYAKFLKNLHSEQINKLIAKNQHECDLLEDIRSFILKRSSIEKSYSEALLKISSAYLNKKIPNIPDIKIEGGEEKWNMWNVWRTVLEENEKLARARLAAVEVFQQQIADDAKILRAHKMQMARKCVEHLAVCQKELQACIQEVDKTKKLYFDEEHCAHDVRDKARDIEEKLKKKKGSFFQSITSLQKNSAKFSSKREQLEEKSTGARNDYLLCLAAANAHQTRYFVVDLQQAMTTMEAGVYDRVAEYLTLMGRTELLTCSAMQNSFTVIRDQAKQLTREYNVQCCYLHYPVLKQHITYEFEACDNDPVETVTAEHDSSAATLSKEARRWATRIARENNVIRESSRKLQIYVALRESGQKTDPNDPNGPDLETKIDEMRENIRKAETARAKAEARIECLREGGVNVDEWLQEAESLNVQDIQRSASSLSDHPSSDSFYDSDFADGEPTAAPTGGSERIPLHSSQDKDKDDTDSQSEQYENPEVDAMLEQERQRIEQLTAGWDDPTQVDWGNEDTHGGEDGDRIRRPGSGESQQQDATSHHPSATLLKCTALYSYTAQNPDELTIVENEQLEVVGEGDGDGWLRARNYKGEEGYVPHNYLDVEREQSSQTTPHGLVNQISFSSVDYTIDNEEDSGQQTETTNQSPEQISVISVSGERPIGWATDTAQELDTPESLPIGWDPNVTQMSPGDDGRSIGWSPDVQPDIQSAIPAAKASSDSTVSYCVALYDYEGEGEEELTLEEGQIIKVLSKCAHSVDDGWWQGELEGRVGNFPSLVVEECDENGEPLTDQWDETPPQSAPPVFTPPDVPNFVMGAASAEMPPSSTEHPPSDPAPVLPETPDTSAFSAFSMALTRNQQQHYGTQFQGPEGVPTIDIPSVEVFGEDDQPEESSSLSNTKQSSSAPAAAGGGSSSGDDFGLGVAQIVITAATPMMEEPDSPFPPPEGDDEDDDNTNDPHHNASPSPDEGVASGGENGCCDPILEENEDEEDEGNDDDLEDDDRGGRHFGNGTPLDDDDFHAKFDEEKDKRQKQESWKKCEPPPRPPLSSEQQQQERQPEMTGCSGSSSGPGQTAVSGAVDLPEELEDDAQGCGGGGGGGGDRTPFLASSSTGSDGETTGPSTAENSVSHVISGAGAGAAAAQVTGPVVVGATATGSTNGDSTVTDIPCKQVVGGRASIPDELEPHQLARLQDLKESNA